MAPPPKVEAPALEDLHRMHRDAHEKLTQYINSATEESLQETASWGGHGLKPQDAYTDYAA
jgi:hypothetical protein